MNHPLTVELPDALYQAVARAAQAAGVSPTEWIVGQVANAVHAENGQPSDTRSEAEKPQARDRFRQMFGFFDSGDPNSADNDKIDADLAREYGSTHDDEA